MCDVNTLNKICFSKKRLEMGVFCCRGYLTYILYYAIVYLENVGATMCDVCMNSLKNFLVRLFRCLFIWYLPASSDWQTADVILCHAGSDTVNGEPGDINGYLVLKMKDILDQTGNQPVIAQGEFARALELAGYRGVVTSNKRQLDRKPGEPYIDSVDVVRTQIQICRKHGFTRPLLVSYQPHICRAAWVMERQGVTPLIPPIPSQIYDTRAEQKWMRSPFLNTPRELLGRIVWLLQGKI